MVSYTYNSSSIFVRVVIFGQDEVIPYGRQVYSAVTLDEYQLETTLRIAVPDNEIDDYNSKITAKITPTRSNYFIQYSVGTPNVAEISVIDDDESIGPLPDISVRAINPVVREGDDILYEIKASHASDTNLELNVASIRSSF